MALTVKIYKDEVEYDITNIVAFPLFFPIVDVKLGALEITQLIHRFSGTTVPLHHG